MTEFDVSFMPCDAGSIGRQRNPSACPCLWLRPEVSADGLLSLADIALPGCQLPHTMLVTDYTYAKPVPDTSRQCRSMGTAVTTSACRRIAACWRTDANRGACSGLRR